MNNTAGKLTRVLGAPDPRNGSYRPLNAFPSSQETLSDIQRWAKECWTTHTKCMREREVRSSGQSMPARLLNIASAQGDNIALCDNLPKTQSPETQADYPYVALSYRWGPSPTPENPIYTLTTDCIEEARQGIAISNLPKTLQDAIYVARVMEVSYMWIDSLCIIQDDNSDKRREIPKMVSIYSGAAAVVSAAASETCRDGFLQPRDISKLLGTIHKFPFYPTEHGPRQGFAYLSEGATTDKDQVELIDKRCWTLQEHIQAVSLLRFGSRQVRWTCQGFQRIDGGIDVELPHDDINTEIFSLSDFSYIYSETTEELEEIFGHIDKWKGLLDEWHGLVQQYTSRSLSDPNDTLPAFAAVAQVWAQRTGGRLGTYRAGLWDFDLAGQLLWYLSTPMVLENKRLNPSWTWASCRGAPLRRNTCLFNNYEITVLSCNIELDDPNFVYGSVVSGELTIKARISPIRELSDFFHSPEKDSLVELPKEDLGIFWDVQNAHQSRSLWQLEIIRRKGQHQTNVRGLILSKGEDGRFQRVGYFDRDIDAGTEWLERTFPVKNEPQIITLV